MRLFRLLSLAVWVLLLPTLAHAQATIATKTCNLTLGPVLTSPDGTAGWTAQFYRNAVKHGQVDSTPVYGPRAAVVDAGTYALSVLFTKTGAPNTTIALGVGKCEGGTVTPPVPTPIPPPVTADCTKDWTLDAVGRTLYKGQDMGGIGSKYACVTVTLYVYGQDLRWWQRMDVTATNPAGSRWDNPVATLPGETLPPPPPPTGQTPVTKTLRLMFTPDPAEYPTVVQRFMLRIADVAGTIVQSTDIGKPALNSSGDVVLPMTFTLLAGKQYYASVQACNAICSVPSGEALFIF